MIGFLSVISKINWTALPCLFSSLLFYSGVAAWSFVGDTGVVYSHKATYLGSPFVNLMSLIQPPPSADSSFVLSITEFKTEIFDSF